MDKNSIIGLVLIALLLFGYTFWVESTQPEVQAPTTTESEVNKVDKATQKNNESASNSLASVDSTALFFNALSKGKEEVVTIENSKLKVEINKKGGEIANVYLKETKNHSDEYKFKSYHDFNTHQNNPLHIYRQNDAHMVFTIDTKEGPIHTNDYDFTIAEKTDSSVIMRLAHDSVSCIDIVYTLKHDNYLVDFEIQSHQMGKYISTATNFIKVDWQNKVSQLEKGFKFENQYSSLTYKYSQEGSEMLSEFEYEKETEFEGNMDWVAFKNQYFSSILIAENSMKASYLESTPMEKGSAYLKEYKADLQTQFDPTGKQPTKFQMYFGPNQFRLLQSMDEFAIGGEKDLELEEIVYLGWPLFKWINRWFTLYVFDFLTKFGLPMGIVLLLITLLMRVIVYVPTKKSFMSSAKMRVLKPKVDEISKKYPKPEDAMRRQQEIMTLYSQYGTSPMGGCLPMLIQMPLWIAMFNFVPNAIELRQEGFLWAEDLSTYDSLISWSTDIPFIGNHLSLFCLLFCATNILYSVMSMRQQRDTMSEEQAQQMKVMQWMMYLMPVFFFFMFNDYSAGLNYYYFISLLASALTMWYLRKTTDDKKLLAKLEANYQANKNNPNKKPSGLAARLEALQKQQQALLDEQRRRQQGQ